MSALRRKLGAFCVLLLLVSVVLAHEPYLLVTANPDGTFTAETGFSDGASSEGLKLIVRDRGTGEVLSEHTLPATGKLTLKMPAAPYRVAFDGGPGHRISKPGPELEVAPVPAAPPAAPSTPASAPTTIPKAAERPAPPPAVVTSPVPSSAPASATHSPASARDDTTRIVLIVGIFFIFGSIAFALGYGAGRRAR